MYHMWQESETQTGMNIKKDKRELPYCIGKKTHRRHWILDIEDLLCVGKGKWDNGPITWMKYEPGLLSFFITPLRMDVT